jgi:CRISPR-associated endonuclease/helicase Cas3
MVGIGGVWGKTNLRELSRKSGTKVLLQTVGDLPKGLRWHSLLHHKIDVGACAEALLNNPVIKRLFRHMTGCDLTPVVAARLVVLIMLHDLGKVMADFQDQIVSGMGKSRGHMQPWLAALLRASDRDDATYMEGLADALGLYDMALWFRVKEVPGDENLESPMEAMLAASTFHHGGRGDLGIIADYDLEGLHRTTVFEVHPMDALRDIMGQIKDIHPDAWGDAPSIPVCGDLIHWFAGLVMISDWMGSASERDRFPYWDGKGTAAERLRFARMRAATLMSDIGIPVARELGTPEPLSVMVDKDGIQMTPRPVQKTVMEVPVDHRWMLIEAQTGDGKTEAAILRYLVLLMAGEVDSLYFAVPTRSAGRELHQRIKLALGRVMPGLSDKIVSAMGGKPTAIYDDTKDIPWAAGDPGRFMAAPVAVGTIDQAYLSVMMTRHAPMRSFLLSRSLLVIDEVHAADPYMTEITRELAQRHTRCGGHVLLMSATLGSAAKNRISSRMKSLSKMSFDDAVRLPYPLISHGIDSLDKYSVPEADLSREKVVRLDMMSLDAALDTAEHAAAMGARVLLIRSTVTDAVATQMALEMRGVQTLDVDGIQTLHHGTFAAIDREKLDEALLEVIGKGSPVRAKGNGLVCVTTQTGEQSLDLNADLMITDPCPKDVFLQRIGRLQRHPVDRPVGFETPRCIVLDPGDLERFIMTTAKSDMITRGVPGFGFPYVYRNLLSVNSLILWIKERGKVRVPQDNRIFVELGSHEEHLIDTAQSMGGRWKALSERLYGRTAAERQAAWAIIFDTHRGFLTSAPSFVQEGRLSTRLGDSSVEIECDEFPAAFGGTIDMLQIPLTKLIQAVCTRTDFRTVTGQLLSYDNGIALISIGKSLYTYGRHGLLPVRS